MESWSLRISTLAVLWVLGLCIAPMSAAAQAPTIRSEWVTGVTTSNALLHAEINPHGLLTKYKLQIDTTGNFRFFQYDSCPLHPPEIGCFQAIVPGDPLPEGLVEPPESTLFGGTGAEVVSVNLAAIGAILQPGTTYHFRAIAANSLDITYGPDLMFTTPLVPPTEEEPPIKIELEEPEPPPDEEPLPVEEETDDDPRTTKDHPIPPVPLAHPMPDMQRPETPSSSTPPKSLNRRKHTKRRGQRKDGSKRIAIRPLRAIR